MRKLLTIGVMAALVTAATASEGTAGAQTDKPSATEVGVSPTEIRIAVAADVDNPFAPGLFQGAVDGVRGGADYVNSKAGGGGIAGRKVVVDFYDTKLNSNEARNATIKACQNDLAMVGGAMIGLSSADDITNCTDKAGQPTGLPDMPTIVSAGETCAPATFPAIGNGQVCNTTTHQIETWLANNGEAKWLLSQHKGIHGPMIVAGDSTSAARGGTAIALGWQKAGVKADQGTSVPVSALAPQSVFTPIIQKMKADGSDFALMSAASNLMKEMRDEATLQGIDSEKVVWDCSSCYGNKIVTENPDSFEGTYQSLNFLPFDEGKSNKTLAAFLRYMKKQGTPDQFAAYGFQAALAFAQAARSAVDAHGVNGLTRSTLEDGLRGMTDFDAGGMAGTHSFKTNVFTNCFVEVQFKDGKWSRVYPAKQGTFTCKPSNIVTIPDDELSG